MEVQKTIPILRIFDREKAIAFYVDWLGFTIDWEHTFGDNSPVYIQVSGNGITLHLSEHHGDGSPGIKVFLECTGLKAYHKMLLNKKYKYNAPGFDRTPYNTWCVSVIDPSGNRLNFNERISDDSTEKE